MRIFAQHVGKENLVHIDDTITTRRSVTELLESLPDSAPERSYFEHDVGFAKAFPDRTFNCWACSANAHGRFNETNVGDVVLLIPTITGSESGVRFLGVVKAKCPVPATKASSILWPSQLSDPQSHEYPYIFFFDAESGHRPWADFLHDIEYKANYNPRGHYRGVEPKRLSKHGGAKGYLTFLRKEGDFKPLQASGAIPSELTQPTADPSELEQRVRALMVVPLQRPDGETQPKKVVAGPRIEYERRPDVKAWVMREANGRCELCQADAPFQRPDGTPYLELHHATQLAEGGPDTVDNAVALCANCHRLLHHGSDRVQRLGQLYDQVARLVRRETVGPH